MTKSGLQLHSKMTNSLKLLMGVLLLVMLFDMVILVKVHQIQLNHKKHISNTLSIYKPKTLPKSFSSNYYFNNSSQNQKKKVSKIYYYYFKSNRRVKKISSPKKIIDVNIKIPLLSLFSMEVSLILKIRV
jgi:hypothetical protein